MQWRLSDYAKVTSKYIKHFSDEAIEGWNSACLWPPFRNQFEKGKMDFIRGEKSICKFCKILSMYIVNLEDIHFFSKTKMHSEKY